MSRSPTPRVLIVEDAPAQLKALCEMLTLEGYLTTGLSTAQGALAALQKQDFELLLTDLSMPDMDGIALLGAAHEIAPDIVAIVMTGDATINTAVKAMQAGALDYIVKPFKMNAILPVLNRALEVRKLRSDNRQLEHSLMERARQLEAANRELESFSYSVSHDLRAPLRAVHNLCQIYMEDFHSTIPAEGLPLLEQVLAGAQRMTQLIEDLLRLSQLGRKPLVRRAVMLGEMVRRITDDLRSNEPQRAIDLSIGDLGECTCDPSLIEQVLVNLLSNAFKFTRGRIPTVIEVGREVTQEGPVYFIRDNGAGFDMLYADQLFGVFQRLHSSAEFEGTGIGLSIVQRIIQRHGGRIWAQSAPEHGCTFYFTLPFEAGAR